MGSAAVPIASAPGEDAAAGLLISISASLLLFPFWRIGPLLRWLVPMVLFCGSSGRRDIALTFDDGLSDEGPSDGQSLQLLLITSNLEGSCQHVARRALGEAHELGNHLYQDEFSIFLSRQEFERQLQEAERQIVRACNRSASRLR